jgi:cyclophilin family peptidyl-prolyl cis-trans isomerase
LKRFLTLAAAVVLMAMASCQTEKDKVTEKPADGTKPVVVLETNMGPIKIELLPDNAPLTVKNFLAYADDKFYDGTIFHRVIPDFMIQAGGFEPGMKREKPHHPPIKSEANNNLRNLRGTVAMGLLPGQPDSGTSQFYINLKHNQHLDGKHTVFGVVDEKSMEVVNKIAAVETHDVPDPNGGPGMHEAVPVKDVIVLAARRVEPSPTSKPGN